TVQIDPSYQQQKFEGWGASLVWSGNATGGYPDEIREKLVDMVFGEDGLRLNIARYNIGGGNAPDVRDDYMKVGATMEGFWNAPEGTTREDMDWWDPDNPDHWNWDADANQRWWIEAIKDRVDHWEAFSNSPPWFQTINGYVSGPFNAGEDSIREDTLDDFGTYLARVMDHLEEAHGIEFDTVDPLNEPNTTYWTTTLGPDGQPVGGRQEGVHAGPELQQKVIQALRDALQGADTDAVISAMDETNPGTFLENWNAYTDESRAAVEQMNVHTYGTGQRTAVRDLAKGDDKVLWQSEVEGSFHSPTDYTSMEPGLGIANRIVNDMRELEPSAWVLWQPIEDTSPQVEGGGNWGSIHIPFDCTDDDTLDSCPIQTNTKFDTIRNFTHYIEPGDRMVKVDDTSSVAALKESGKAATVVHVNDSTSSRDVTLDLSLFKKIDRRATVTPIVSGADGGLVEGDPVWVDGDSASVVVPAKSVTTFVVDGVSGVAKDAALVQPDHVYRLEGVQSGHSLAPSEDGSGAVIRSTDTNRADQLWSVEQLTDGLSNRERYAISNVDSGQRLAMRDGSLVLEDPASSDGDIDDAAQWTMSTTGDGTYTFVNAATGRLIDVSGHATGDGSPVGTWTPSSGANQRWTVIDETVAGTDTAEVFTVPGLAPELPATVAGVYRDGVRGELPVTWEPMPDARWAKPGTVLVPGEATDALGRTFRAEAIVTVDAITSTRPGRAKTYVGAAPGELPETVVGVGEHGAEVDVPVTWESAPDGAFDDVGVATLDGVAEVIDGSTVEATLRVQVTEPVEANAALDDGVEASATFTEGGYSPDRLRNGNTTEKAWSNWKSGDTKNPSDTVTFELPAGRDVTRVVTHFYRDGNNPSVAESLRVEIRDADGTWVDASGDVEVEWDGGDAPVVDVPVSADSADAVRVVMAARPSGYMTLSEIEVYADAPGVSSNADAASIEVDGVPIDGFDPGTDTYEVTVQSPRRSVVAASAADPYATVGVEDTSSDQLNRTVVVAVQSEDGSQTQEYRVRLVRR
ncbi:glycoside hydrolase, partial [Phytoactinopolyspora endophytica]|uniref:glycoside hydrolase n=1 Tax=Phytoactinopolyspora endophytica TaxID=1642495 RepID=UPI00197B28FA